MDSGYVSGWQWHTEVRWCESKRRAYRGQMIGCRPHREANSPKEEEEKKKKIDDTYYLD